jgi:hypothetical protein
MRDPADDELGESYDGFGGGSDEFANSQLSNERFDEYYKHQVNALTTPHTPPTLNPQP